MSGIETRGQALPATGLWSRLGAVALVHRVVALAVVAVVGVVVLAVIGWTRIEGAEAAAARAALSGELTTAGRVAQFDAADVNGWQTAYAFDVTLTGAEAAKDSAPSRRAFLAGAERMREHLAGLDAHPQPLDPAERAALDAAVASFEEFMAIDERVIDLYRAGTPGAKRQGDRLVLEDAIAAFNQVTGHLATFVTAAQDQQQLANAERRAEGERAKRLLLVVAVLTVLVVLAAGYVIITSVRRGLSALRDRLRDIAEGEGDLTIRLDAGGPAELAQIAGYFNTFMESLADLVRRMAGLSGTIAAASEELSSTSRTVSRAADQTAGRAGSVAGAAHEVETSVANFSTAANELGLSISEISRNAAQAAQIVASAVDIAERTSRTVTELGASSAEIAGVVNLIEGVAAQTNLLALNATIEAARAGEAGKGFAVVASEVKDLAQETARATQDISQRITDIQHQSGASVLAIGEITTVISQINDLQASIAGAVEEQTATTGELSRAVVAAAAGSQEITGSIRDVADAADTTKQSITESQVAIDDLARLSGDLDGLARRFHY